MTERWHRTRDLVGLPGMPNKRAINMHGPSRGWISRPAPGHSQAREWLESSLPPETQAALRERRGGDSVPSLLSPWQGGVADARLEIVAEFDRWRKGRNLSLVPALKEWTFLYAESGCGVSGETRAHYPTVAWNTVQRWRQKRLERGARGLLPGRGGRKSLIETSIDFSEEAEALMFERPNHVTAPEILETLEARYPDRDMPGIDAIRRWMRKWRANNARRLSAVADPDKHRSHRMPAFGDPAAEIKALNYLWELDSTSADAICADRKRYYIVVGIDVWSRRVKCVVVPTSKATAIAALLRRMLLEFGVPAVVRTDQGSDYTSQHIRRILMDLDVVHDVLAPYRPDQKPFVERFIHTLNHRLIAKLPGFSGHNVADRQALRARKSFSARRGEDVREAFNCDLTAEQLQARIDAWCTHVYERRPHNGLAGMSPFAKAASWTGERRQITDERALDVLLAEPVDGKPTRIVSKRDGIRADSGSYIAAELGRIVGEEVHVRRDPADYGRVFVFVRDENDPKRWRFYCLAEDPVRTGIDRQEVARKAKELARQQDSADRQWARDRKRDRKPEAAIDDVLDAATRAAGNIVSLPFGAETHTTPELEAAAAAADARDAMGEPEEAPRRAAGMSDFELFRQFQQLQEETDD